MSPKDFIYYNWKGDKHYNAKNGANTLRKWIYTKYHHKIRLNKSRIVDLSYSFIWNLETMLVSSYIKHWVLKYDTNKKYNDTHTCHKWN